VVSLPLSRKANGNSDGLDLRSIDRSKMKSSVCGTGWLRQHVDTKEFGALGVPSIACKEEDEEHADD
jgi:hypothetical protein